MRPLGKYKLDHQRHIREVLNDITENNFRITQIIGDNPIRSRFKGCKNHSAWFPCEYCFSKGIKIEISDNSKARKKLLEQKNLLEEKIIQCQTETPTPERARRISNLESLREEILKSMNSLKRKSNILWPYSTIGAQHRSRNSVLEILEKIENNGQLSIDEAKGIVFRSPLLDLPNFNYIYDVPAEYLHSGCLGVIKRLVELTFQVGEKRTRITKRKLSSPKSFNILMLMTLVPQEFPRRARNLDTSVFKGQEYRNLCIFFFPLVLDCIENSAKERHLWLYLAYIIRSATIPTEEFSQINVDQVCEFSERFYKLFEQLFGKLNCPYNLHVFCGHVMEIRTHGPLTETSAFKFESFYGEMRRSFVPGTPSPLKQIMKNVLLARTIRKHKCVNNMFISNYDTSLECNKLIYTFEKNEYQFYQVSDIEGDIVTCNKIGKYPAIFPETPDINWSTVGVFKKGGVSDTQTNLNSSKICGKLLHVGKYLLTCPKNVLNEK